MTEPTAQTSPTARCASCGTSLSGPFCHQCGAGTEGATCSRCRQRSPAGSRFCSHCGGPLSPGAAPPAGRSGGIGRQAPWALGLVLAAALVALLVRQPAPGGPGQGGAVANPVPAEPAAAAAPDISSLTPRERFMRLYDRVIGAAQAGDQATVDRFLPMALGAYQQLDAIDADARYHLAMIQLHVGDPAGAQAQADTLTKGEPDHLFGWVIDAAVARWNQDGARRDAAYRELLSRWDREMATAKPEYLEHKTMLEQLKRTAGGS